MNNTTNGVLLHNREDRELTFRQFLLYDVLCTIWSISNSRFPKATDIKSDRAKTIVQCLPAKDWACNINHYLYDCLNVVAIIIKLHIILIG